VDYSFDVGHKISMAMSSRRDGALYMHLWLMPWAIMKLKCCVKAMQCRGGSRRVHVPPFPPDLDHKR